MFFAKLLSYLVVHCQICLNFCAYDGKFGNITKLKKNTSSWNWFFAWWIKSLGGDFLLLSTISKCFFLDVLHLSDFWSIVKRTK